MYYLSSENKTKLSLSIVLVGRNDDYGGGFRERLFRSTEHNFSLLKEAGIEFDVTWVEWNPMEDKPLLAEDFLSKYDFARAIVVPPTLHERYNRNPHMSFHEMPAKNVGIRRAVHEWVLPMNAEVLFDEALVEYLASTDLHPNTIYRAHRIDVPAGLDWQTMKAPESQIESSEGVVPPCYYLGAAGDFLLAHRRAWFSLRGVNETVRFSTRCKDWQFLLNAKRRGYAVETIGRVYHLEHEVGFRNTPVEIRHTERAHFGPMWDIEFGLPFENNEHWGMASQQQGRLSCEPQSIRILSDAAFDVDDSQERLSDWLQQALSVEDDSSYDRGGYLLHLLLAAHREGKVVEFKLKDPKLWVTLDGLVEIAAQFGVEVFGAPRTELFDGYVLEHLHRADHGEEIDWVVEEFDDTLMFNGVPIHDTGVLPVQREVASPRFDPLLLRRLLLLYLRLSKDGMKSLHFYGAGTHTQEVLRWGVPDDFEVNSIVVTTKAMERWEGYPVTAIAECALGDGEALVASSNSFETEMLEEAKRCGLVPVYPLYADWE